ncbi:MAG: transporter substrate-binding domain-containing protein, partial [Lachnospiraceae bacterium]|nr:transporter substrate-binding domain-containing protein [Lachnospiraceae bacterium]
MMKTALRKCNRITMILLVILLTAAFILPSFAAPAESKTVRVGWYESPFNSTDETGRRSGYAYEYQQKIAAYTGWKYEYVKASWVDLLEMLESGEIDLISDVSFTPDRADKMLFSALPMGSEEYYIFIANGRRDMSPDDISTLNGKIVGVNRGSLQADMYRDWALQNNIDATVVLMNDTIEESIAKLTLGTIDAYIVLDSFIDHDTAVPFAKIGESDFYFAISNSRPDLKIELDAAMSKIRTENRHFNHDLYEKFVTVSNAQMYLAPDELSYVIKHGPIRVGYQDNYLAFCAADENGNLTGALGVYLDNATNAFENARLVFEPVVYPTAVAALEALKNGEVDCMFPSNLDAYSGEIEGLVMTSSLMESEMLAVVRQGEIASYNAKPDYTVAVNEGNTNYELFLKDNFPTWKMKYFSDTQACLEGIAKGEADCILISNYRFSNISKQCEKLKLTSVATGVDMDYSFAVRLGDSALYSILSKTTSIVPESHIEAALSRYVSESAKLTLRDVIRNNHVYVNSTIGIIVLVIIGLLLKSLRAEMRAKEGRELISATENDRLTGLYNRSYFYQYVHRSFREHPEKQMDAGMLNIDNFHSVNELIGREFGDKVLCAVADSLKEYCASHDGLAGRADGDHFAFLAAHSDDYQPLFDGIQAKLDSLAKNANVRLRMGVMPYQKGLDADTMFDRARTAVRMARANTSHLVVFDESMMEKE